MARRSARELQLAEMAVAEGQSPAEMWLVKGECLTSLSQYGQAIECFQNAIDLAEKGTTVLLEAYYGPADRV